MKRIRMKHKMPLKSHTLANFPIEIPLIVDSTISLAYSVKMITINRRFGSNFMMKCVIICSLLVIFIRDTNAENMCSFNTTSTENEFQLVQTWQCDDPTDSQTLKLIKLEGNHSSNVIELDPNYLNSFPNLRTVDISGNKIDLIGAQKSQSQKDSITFFNISHNNLMEHVTWMFEYMQNLNKLDFSFNKFPKLTSSDFSKAPKLAWIDGSNNQITELEHGVFGTLDHLEYLDLSGNAISLLSIKTFENNTRIQYLNLQKNSLEKFSFEMFPSVTSIDVHLPTESIEELNISCGKLVCLFEDFEKLASFENLHQLNAAGNHFTNVIDVLNALTDGIESLDLSGTFFGSINGEMFERFVRLKFLYLSGAGITNIKPDAFDYQKSLILLDLSNNDLTEVDSFLLPNHLQTLNLKGNQLTNIDIITPDRFPRLNSLEIYSNRFSCDYLVNFLKKWKNNDDLQLVGNPSFQANIRGIDALFQLSVNGIDCHIEKQQELLVFGIAFGVFILCLFAFGAIVLCIIRRKPTTKRNDQPRNEYVLKKPRKRYTDYEVSDSGYDASGQVYINQRQMNTPRFDAPQRPMSNDYQNCDVIYENSLSNDSDFSDN